MKNPILYDLEPSKNKFALLFSKSFDILLIMLSILIVRYLIRLSNEISHYNFLFYIKVAFLVLLLLVFIALIYLSAISKVAYQVLLDYEKFEIAVKARKLNIIPLLHTCSIRNFSFTFNDKMIKMFDNNKYIGGFVKIELQSSKIWDEICVEFAALKFTNETIERIENEEYEEDE